MGRRDDAIITIAHTIRRTRSPFFSFPFFFAEKKGEYSFGAAVRKQREGEEGDRMGEKTLVVPPPSLACQIQNSFFFFALRHFSHKRGEKEGRGF